MSNAIEITALTKRFGHVTALDELTMTVGTGDIHGFLGPNGAGKSTTIRVLLGLLRADGGTVRLLGGDPWNQAPELHRRISYVPGDVNLWPNLTGGEAIDLIGRARGGIDKVRRNEMIERFDLDPRKRGRTYSKGNRQKVALVAALACPGDLLLLDEPTSGLDPLMERTFTTILRDEVAQGRTVLLSSHILSEVEELCDRVSIIKSGRIVEAGTLAELRHLHRTEVAATFPGPVPEELSLLAGVANVRVDGDRWSAQVDDAALPGLLQRLGALGVTGLTSSPPSLEELFFAHYESADQAVDARSGQPVSA